MTNNETLMLSGATLRALNPKDDKPTTPAPDDATKQDDTQTGDTKPDDTDKPQTLDGYAIVFNTPSKDLGGFTEVVDPKALDGVDLSKVIMLFNHDYGEPLATAENGTLKLDVDDKGLHFVATLPTGVSYADDLYKQVDAGNINSASFSFSIDDGSDEWTQDDDGNIVRTIKQVKDLYEVSAVSLPAYEDTNVETAQRGYQQFLKTQGDQNQMTMKTTITPETTQDKETRALEDFIKSHGEKRDGLVGLSIDKTDAVIPESVVTPIFKGANDGTNLANLATVKNVTTGAGKYPVSIPDPTKFLATTEELADYPDVQATVTTVPFNVETRRGAIYLSEELVMDSAIDITTEVSSQLQQLVTNTDNYNMAALLQKLTSEDVTSIDGLKHVKNTEIDPAVLAAKGSVVITNQTGYDFLDRAKDSDGRYLLTTDLTLASGKALFGLPIVVMADVALPNVSGKAPIFIGNLPQTVAVFRRSDVTVEWTEFKNFAKGLAVALRNDYKFIDQNAMKYVLIDPATATTTTDSTTTPAK